MQYYTLKKKRKNKLGKTYLTGEIKLTEIVHQELDPDPFFSDADPHQNDADPQHWYLLIRVKNDVFGQFMLVIQSSPRPLNICFLLF